MEVFDGKTDTSPGLGRFCGSKVSIVASSAAVLIAANSAVVLIAASSKAVNCTAVLIVASFAVVLA